MNIPEFNDIIESNDQTEARREHLEKIRELVGNAYPNKFDRTNISGDEDTISNLVSFAPVIETVKELKDATPEGEKPDQELKAKLNEKLKAFGNVRISGRLAVPPRVMGKAAFVHLSDGINRLQIYVRRDDVQGVYNGTLENENPKSDIPNPKSVSGWNLFQLLDHGDFIGAEGFLFLTNTGELSVHVETIQFLSKSLMPMPDKMHDIGDAEISRRYRYVDLIASSLRNKTDEEIEEEKRTGVKKLTTREVFERRAKLIGGMRRYLDEHGYIEVETPMLTPKATGAAAEPFETHHKALGIPLYARIAPELYLKRLTVGGFEKVYELNRNFRNEGLSHKHNPEFTMLEFYCAYMDVNGMMDFAEAMIKESVQKVTGGSLVVNYDGKEIDFSKFERLTMKEAIVRHWQFETLGNDKFEENWLNDSDKLKRLHIFDALLHAVTVSQTIIAADGLNSMEWHRERNAQFHKAIREEKKDQIWEQSLNYLDKVPTEQEAESLGIESFAFAGLKFAYKRLEGINNNERKDAFIIEKFFEDFAEAEIGIFKKEVGETLIQPTFIIDYPKSISPLSKASPENPNIAERFELFINGMEVANGFSELNDPVEQFERFKDQMREREGGDAEAMILDEDYIRALAYGMPPAAGIGIGIDRLVMLLTNKHSIRDVILFPHMRPIVKEEETES